MAENQNVKPATTNKFAAGVKEWFRKRIVGLKRKTHIIPLLVTLIASIVYLLNLRTVSKSALDNYNAGWLGIAMFVVTLFSILILALYIYAFPKRKKPNIVMLVLIFVFAAAMIGMDVLYYISLSDYLKTLEEAASLYYEALDVTLAHIIILGISVVLLATLPLYKKLIMKINTRKDLEENEIKEEIDTSAEV